MGKRHDFGPWDNREAALDKHLREKDYLHSGRVPPAELIGLTRHQLCHVPCESKETLVTLGELSPKTLTDYEKSHELRLKHFGKDRLVSDLTPVRSEKYRAKLAERFDVNSLQRLITSSRSVSMHRHDVSAYRRRRQLANFSQLHSFTIHFSTADWLRQAF